MYHLPVMLSECVDALVQDVNGVYVDLTFGGGGHSHEILKRLGEKGKLIAFDIDGDAIKNKINDKRLILVNQNFRYMWHYLNWLDVLPVDGVLADLGVSSFQIDEASRGFSIRNEGFLNMRMGGAEGLTAFDVLNKYNIEELKKMFWDFGDIKNAHKLSDAIIQARTIKAIETTGQLKEIATNCAPIGKEYKYLSKVFQAVRIEVNDELKALEEMLQQLEWVLKEKAKVVIMSYHSMEDRLVKNLFKTGNIKGNLEKDFYGNKLSPYKMVNNKPISPSEKEIEINLRARSAKLRIAEKIRMK